MLNPYDALTWLMWFWAHLAMPWPEMWTEHTIISLFVEGRRLVPWVATYGNSGHVLFAALFDRASAARQALGR